MKIQNLRKKIATLGVTILTFLIFFGQNVFADPQGALGQAKDNVINQAKPIVNSVIVPVILVILVAIVVVLIAKAVASYRRGLEVELLGIILLVVGITLVSTFPIWGWALIS